MPNYKYICECKEELIITMSIKTDPDIVIPCPKCKLSMKRVFQAPTDIKVEKNTLGNWYKRKTGKELMDG